jgi:hypothetical protein
MNEIFASMLLLVVVAFVIGCSAHDQHELAGLSMAPINVVQKHNADDQGQGFTRRPGLEIVWAGNTSKGVDTLDVINATISRMQFEQDTDALASDQNARALAHLMMARQELEGKTTTTEDGLPILE